MQPMQLDPLYIDNSAGMCYYGSTDERGCGMKPDRRKLIVDIVAILVVGTILGLVEATDWTTIPKYVIVYGCFLLGGVLCQII